MSNQRRHTRRRSRPERRLPYQAAWREAADILEELKSAEANEVRALLTEESQRREAPAAEVGKLKERRGEFTL